jgi:L-ascorbate metabolism protein UlaG (beta-lactamase superfamily)
MEIKYFGYSFFRLKGKEMVLCTDPFDDSLGLKVPPQASDIVLFSSPAKIELGKAINQTASREKLFMVDGPGEYEVGGVFILGNQSEKSTVYVITMDGLRLVFLGGLTEKLTDKQIEEIDVVDILFLPVGDRKMALDTKKAAEITNQIEPKIIIPMSYQIPGLKVELGPIDDFLKEMGIEEKNLQDKLIVAKDKLPLEKEVVILNARS